MRPLAGLVDDRTNAISSDFRKAVEQVQSELGLSFPVPAFAEFARSKLGSPATFVEAVEPVWMRDLALAYAALQGDPRAIRLVQRRCGSLVAAAIERAGAADSEELTVEVWEEVLVGSGSRKPALAGYSGRGPLQRWIYVVARRLAGKSARQTRHHANDDADLLPDFDDPETRQVKDRTRDAFAFAVRSSLRKLARREQELLRRVTFESASLTELAEELGVDRTTVGRWVKKAKNKLYRHTEETLADKTGGSIRELVAVISSDLHVSFLDLLTAGLDPDGSG